MDVTITARHCEIPDPLRNRAMEVVQRLARVAHRPHHTEVVFDDDHQRKVVELKMTLVRTQVLVATAEAGDFRTALDRAAEKLRPQLERTAAKKGRGAGAAP